MLYLVKGTAQLQAATCRPYVRKRKTGSVVQNELGQTNGQARNNMQVKTEAFIQSSARRPPKSPITVGIRNSKNSL